MSAVQELISAIEGIQDWGGTYVGECIAAVEAEGTNTTPLTNGDIQNHIAVCEEVVDLRARLQTAEQQRTEQWRISRELEVKLLVSCAALSEFREKAQAAEQQLGQVREEVERLRSALSFYAAEGVYTRDGWSGRLEPVMDDSGDKAREALSATPSDGCGKGRTEVPAFLREMAERLRAQDNLATSHPLYCVLQTERVYGMERDYGDKYEWKDVTSGDYTSADPEEVKQLEQMDEDGEDTIIDGTEFEKHFYIEHDRFITASLTRAGAEEHLRLNGHNLPGAHIYVTSLYRTPDMIALREWILSLAASSSGEEGAE